MTTSKIMVVEDERIVAMDLRQRLTDLGYEVVALAADGQTAVTKARELHPDLVLMDIHLEGGSDGIAAGQAIFSQLHIPIVFLTAYADDAILKRAISVAPYGYLVKPTSPRELNATISAALSRRDADKALERSEERLRLAIDSARLGVWEWETASGAVSMMGDVGPILGEQLEPVGETIEQLLTRVHVSDRQRIREALEEVRMKDSYLETEFRGESSNGKARYIEVHAKLYGGGRVVGVLKDITARRDMEDSLRKAAAIYGTIAEATAIMDLDGNVVSVNPAFEKMTGFSQHDVLGRNLDAVLQIARRGRKFYAALTEAKTATWSGEVKCHRHDGHRMITWQSLGVVRDEHGTATHFVLSMADVSALRGVQEQLRHLAHHDALTGMANRLLFRDRLEVALARAKRRDMYCAVMFIDLDGFKVINDTLGHEIGDQLLVLTARRLKKAMRASDSSARLGGDEFVIVASDLNTPSDAVPLAEKLIACIRQPATMGGQTLVVSASIGISVYPGDGVDVSTMLKSADIAMYAAKSAGRNRYAFYTAKMAEQAAERLLIEQGLRRALEHGDLRLLFQPVVRFDTREITGIEALVRWQHPTRGLLPPHEFISTAEGCGLIAPLGRWVLRTACIHAATMHARGIKCRLCVNVSPQQFVADQLDINVEQILRETQFPASYLELELTESCLKDIDKTRPVLDRLRAMGVTISVDDFGAGYSSLGILKDLPIDRLKIDRSFVRALETDHADTAVVTAIAQFSQALGLATTVEGVEDDETLQILKRIGFGEGQGFHFCEPVAMQALLARVGEGNRLVRMH